MTASSHPQERPQKRSGLWDFLPLAVVFALLFAASFLPPDNSRQEVDRLGRLSVCMPTVYPPLVTGDADAPGFEVELMREVATRLDWQLNIVSNSAMGRDFNPRSWRINRAQCQMLAGGIALNQNTRSFLDTAEPHLVTGWALIARPGETLESIESPVGFLAGLAGLDRLSLSQYLRNRSITATIVNEPSALIRGLETGEFDAAITEGLLAQQLFSDSRYEVSLLDEPIERFGLGLGFWKGDQTLKRAVVATLEDIWKDGTASAIAERYNLGPETLCGLGTDDC